MKLLPISLLTVFIAIGACQSNPNSQTTASANVTPDSLARKAVADAVHGFYNWYNSANAGQDKLSNNFLDASGKTYRVDPAKVEVHLAQILNSEFVAAAWLKDERAFIAAHEKSWNETSTEDVPDYLDGDRFYCAQDWNGLLYCTTPMAVEVNGATAIASMTVPGHFGAIKYELISDSGKWLISKFICPESANEAAAGEAAQTEVVPVKAPAEYIVELWEQGGQAKANGVDFTDNFETVVASHFASFKAAGATKMPPMKFKLHGTVGMGTRQELETEYAEQKAKSEK